MDWICHLYTLVALDIYKHGVLNDRKARNHLLTDLSMSCMGCYTRSQTIETKVVTLKCMYFFIFGYFLLLHVEVGKCVVWMTGLNELKLKPGHFLVQVEMGQVMLGWSQASCGPFCYFQWINMITETILWQQ